MIVRMCLASNVNTEQLRFQLDQLHKEASETAAKANNARLRLLRLSEAAEKLRQQAAKSIQAGKDNDARELLIQKKKILQAMERSKSRAHLLDELAAKLNKAISVKETLLIGKVSSDLEFGKEDHSSTVHVVSPVQEAADIVYLNENSSQGNIAVCEESDSQHECGIKSKISDDEKPSKIAASDNIGKWIESELPDNIGKWIESELPSSMEGISSYNHFLGHLDSQLSKIEADLAAYLKLIYMVLEDKEMTTNMKQQQVKEILHKVLDTRRSIKKFLRSVDKD